MTEPVGLSGTFLLSLCESCRQPVVFVDHASKTAMTFWMDDQGRPRMTPHRADCEEIADAIGPQV